MKIKACIMSIAHPKRLLWLHETIKHIEEQKFPFYKKVIVIDQFDGFKVPDFLNQKLIDWGWEVKKVALRSRVQSMDLFFEDDGTDVIFYNEEDVKATLPDYKFLTNMFETSIENRKCGIVSLSVGGMECDYSKRQIGDLAFCEKNKIYSSESYYSFLRLEDYKSKWFFEFPGLFVIQDIFEKCHKKAKEYINFQVEMGLTKAYFELNFDKIYFKSSVCKNNLLEVSNSNPSEINNLCRLLTNLDPNQGNSPLGGHHTY